MVNWTPRDKPQWNLNRNSYIFIQENANESVVGKVASILSRPQCANYQVASYITTPSIDSMCGYSVVNFMADCISYFTWFCWFYIQFILLIMSIYIMSNLIFIITNVYVFDWYICQLVWDTFEMTWFVQVTEYRIGVKRSQKSELWNGNPMKASSFWEWAAISKFCHEKFRFHASFIFLLMNTFEACQTMVCLINAVKRNITNLVFHWWIRYCHTCWLVCEYNAKLRNVDLIFVLKW